MIPESKLEWTPGPTGVPVPPTFEELKAGLVDYADSRSGITIEAGSPRGDMPVVNVVYRDAEGEPLGILAIVYYDGTPELVDIAVDPDHRRMGIAWDLCVAAKDFGIDLRDIGAVHEGPLTDDGRALRDMAFARGAEIYGPPSWEEQ